MTAGELPQVVEWLRRCTEVNCLPDSLIPGSLLLYPRNLTSDADLMQGTPSASYWCVRFLFKSAFSSNYMSVMSGKVKAGDFFLETGYYVLGTTPYAGQVNGTIVYRFNNDHADWYIKDRSTNYSTPAAKASNPFGPNWTLCRWPHTELSIRIDDHSPRKERRLIRFSQYRSRQLVVT